MPGDRALADGNNAEVTGPRERGQHAAFGDAEHRAQSAFATDMQPRIAVAGDYESVGRIVRLDQPAQRQHNTFDSGLGLDTEWTFGKRRAHDLRTVLKTQGLKCRIETPGHCFICIWINDANTRLSIAHGFARRDGSCPIAPSSSCSVVLQAKGDRLLKT